MHILYCLHSIVLCLYRNENFDRMVYTVFSYMSVNYFNYNYANFLNKNTGMINYAIETENYFDIISECMEELFHSYNYHKDSGKQNKPQLHWEVCAEMVIY